MFWIVTKVRPAYLLVMAKYWSLFATFLACQCSITNPSSFLEQNIGHIMVKQILKRISG
jgi:hypothetical protein